MKFIFTLTDAVLCVIFKTSHNLIAAWLSIYIFVGSNGVWFKNCKIVRKCIVNLVT